MPYADHTNHFHSCPRCGARGLERFATHSYCLDCNYEEIYDFGEVCAIPQWAIEAIKTVKPKSIVRELIAENKDYQVEIAG